MQQRSVKHFLQSSLWTLDRYVAAVVPSSFKWSPTNLNYQIRATHTNSSHSSSDQRNAKDLFHGYRNRRGPKNRFSKRQKNSEAGNAGKCLDTETEGRNLSEKVNYTPPDDAMKLQVEIDQMTQYISQMMNKLGSLQQSSSETTLDFGIRKLKGGLAPEAEWVNDAVNVGLTSGLEALETHQPMRQYDETEVNKIAVLPAKTAQRQKRHVAMATIVGVVVAPVVVCHDPARRCDFAQLRLEAQHNAKSEKFSLEVRAYDQHLLRYAVQTVCPGQELHCLGHLVPTKRDSSSSRDNFFIIALTDPGCLMSIVYGAA